MYEDSAVTIISIVYPEAARTVELEIRLRMLVGSNVISTRMLVSKSLVAEPHFEENIVRPDLISSNLDTQPGPIRTPGSTRSPFGGNLFPKQSVFSKVLPICWFSAACTFGSAVEVSAGTTPAETMVNFVSHSPRLTSIAR